MIAAIQAGGNSRRMSRDKAFIKVGGRRLIERVLAVAQPVADRLLIVTSESKADLPAYQSLAKTWGAELRIDLQPECGPLGGVETALAECEPAGAVLVLACDLPFLSSEFLTILQRRHRESGASITVPLGPNSRVEPLVAIYSSTCLPAVKAQIASGHLRVDLLYDLVPTTRLRPEEYLYLSGSERFFVNFNTPADVEEASSETKQG
jgi:molybdopterin-guanine dinucleotide biosynthesis protein A